MPRSVGTPHWTAWWRSHRAPSRWSAGSVCRRRSGRGGKRGAGATSTARSAPLAPRHPDHEAGGPHDRDRLPGEARPPPPLILLPAHLTWGLFMARRDGVPPMGLAGPRFPRGRGRPLAPGVRPLRGRTTRGALAPQPADRALARTGDAPAPHGHQLLPPPPLGALPPPTRPPRPARPRLPQLLDPRRRARRLPLLTHPASGPPPDAIPLLPRGHAPQQGRVGPVVGLGHRTAPSPGAWGSGSPQVRAP
jgi:hypothetical protein